VRIHVRDLCARGTARHAYGHGGRRDERHGERYADTSHNPSW
jgi:hypothetical protein